MNIRMVPALSGRANPVIMGELTCQISENSSTATKEALTGLFRAGFSLMLSELLTASSWLVVNQVEFDKQG